MLGLADRQVNSQVDAVRGGPRKKKLGSVMSLAFVKANHSSRATQFEPI